MSGFTRLPVFTLAALLVGASPVAAGNFFDDACPDAGGKTFVVDTPAKAQSVANGYNLPGCDLVIRVNLDPDAINRTRLQITAKSIALEGPLEISNPLPGSSIVLRVLDGNITVSQSRLVAKDTIRLECHGSTPCNISITRQSHLQAPRAVRTITRGRLTIEDTKIVSGEMDTRAAGR